METSGHGALRENFFLDDGAYGALKIVIESVKRRLEGGDDIAELLASLKEPKEAMEIRIKILADDVRSEGDAVTAAFKEWVEGGNAPATWTMEAENYEGWRVAIDEGDGNSGWLLVRCVLDFLFSFVHRRVLSRSFLSVVSLAQPRSHSLAWGLARYLIQALAPRSGRRHQRRV
jgi:hypothetical protein